MRPHHLRHSVHDLIICIHVPHHASCDEIFMALGQELNKNRGVERWPGNEAKLVSALVSDLSFILQTHTTHTPKVDESAAPPPDCME